MPRKKKTESKAVTKKVVEQTPTTNNNPRKGQVFYKNYADLAEHVLGRVYKIDGVIARLVYVGEKCKFIIE